MTLAFCEPWPIRPMRQTFPFSGPRPAPISIDVLVAQAASDLGLVDSLRHPDGGERGDAAGGVLHVEGEAHRLQAVPEHLRVRPVTFPARLEALLDHEAQAFAEGVDERRGDRVVVGAVPAPVALEEVEVEVPGVGGPGAGRHGRAAERAHRDRGHPRRAAQALLRAGVGRVRAPLVEEDRCAPERRHAIHDQQGAVAVGDLAEAVHRLERPGRGLGVDEGHGLRLRLRHRGLDLLGREHLAPLLLDLRRPPPPCARPAPPSGGRRSPPRTRPAGRPARGGFRGRPPCPPCPSPRRRGPARWTSGRPRAGGARVSSRRRSSSGSRWPRTGAPRARITRGWTGLGPGPRSSRAGGLSSSKTSMAGLPRGTRCPPTPRTLGRLPGQVNPRTPEPVGVRPPGNRRAGSGVQRIEA